MPKTDLWKNADSLRVASAVYISLPLFLFIAGFLRWYYAVICCAALIMCLSAVFKEKTQRNTMGFTRKTISLVFLFSLLWSYLGGMNGYYYQSFDWDCRNAVYFDLIQYDWPVIYPLTGGALVYYIGHWLPPAAAAKIFLLISGSAEVGLFAGRMLLWLWSSIGLTIVILLLYRVLQAQNKKQRIAVTLIFVFFSGMDFLGALWLGNLSYYLRATELHALTPHLEPWCFGFQFSSVMTCLFWVFNQTIVPWIITALFLLEDSPRNYVFFGVCCLLCGPFLCVGLAVLMIAKAVMFCVNKWKQGEQRQAFRDIFSTQNILVFLVLFPVIAAYILSANAVSGGASDGGQQYKVPLFSTVYLNFQLYLFILIEVGVYLLLIATDHYKNPLYYVCWATFILFPCVHIGTSIDFCMRATIPALFVLMVYVCKYLMEHLKKPKKGMQSDTIIFLLRKHCARFLLVCYIFGMATPLVELYRGAYHVITEKTIFLEDQRLMTLNREGESYNFVTQHPEEHFFFKYLSK